MFDTHAHYYDSKFDKDRESLLDCLFTEKGVENIINCGCDIESSLQSIEFAEKYAQMYAAVGIHPQEADNAPEDYLAQLEQMLTHTKVVAIGEIGLDYYYETPSREVQKRFFTEQMQLAEKTGYPVIIHDRDAHQDCMDIALSYSKVRGVFHSFSGSMESMRILIKVGWYISVSGVVTFKNAQKLPEIAAAVDEDRLLVETDCPYLTPAPFRGKRNDSGYMEYTIKKIAELRGTTPEYIERITAENAKRLFNIS